VTSVACALAAVDVTDFAHHEAGTFEVHDRADDIGDFAHAADGVQGGSCAYGSGECIGVLMVPGATTFTRMPRFAYSNASDLVAASDRPWSATRAQRFSR